MSLTAKIEAVIYASEEPVTLSQLVGLLGVEAQAELDAQDALQGSLLPLEMAATESDELDEDGESDGLDPEALNAETLGSSAPEAVSETTAAAESPSDPVTDGAMEPEEKVPEPDASSHAAGSQAAGSQPAGTQSAGSHAAGLQVSPASEAEAKREARERERRLRDYFRSLLDRLIAEYAEGDRGLEIREVAGGFRFGTKPEYHDTVRGFVRSLKPPLKLSLQALETLAVVSYKQPITAPEIGEIRGVDSAGVLGSLIARKLITTAGRKQVIGRPILYKTTKEFLLRFGLKDINELPSIEEFERMAGELNEAVQEEMEMENAPAPGSPVEDAAGSPAETCDTDQGSVQPPTLDDQETAPMDITPRDPNADGTDGQAADVDATAVEVTNVELTQENESMRDVHERQSDGVPN